MADETQKKIVVSIETDASNASQGIDEVKGKLAELNSMGVTPFKDFKRTIQEAVAEAAKLKEQFGENSEQFQQASQRLLQLKEVAVQSLGTITTKVMEASKGADLMGQKFGDASPEFQKAALGVAALNQEMEGYAQLLDNFNPEDIVVGISTNAEGVVEDVTATLESIQIEDIVVPVATDTSGVEDIDIPQPDDVTVKYVPDTTEVEDVPIPVPEVPPVEVPPTLKTLKQQLKEAKETALELQQAGKMDTKEYQEAIKFIAKVKDEQDVLNRTVAAFDPGNKLQALVKVGQTAVSGLQGVAGAMALVGVESDKAATVIAQLQGALALKDSLGDIQDFLKGYSLRIREAKQAQDALTVSTEAGAVAQQGATVATKAFGLAFKAIGIGLLISAVAALVANWDKVRDAVVKVVPALGNMGEQFNKLKAIAMGVGNTLLQYFAGPVKAIIQTLQGDFSGALDSLKDMFRFRKNFQEGYNNEILNQEKDAAAERTKTLIDENTKRIEVLKARGQDTYALEKENFKRRLSVEKEGSEEYNKLQQEQAVFEASHQKNLEDKRKAANDKAASERKAANEKLAEQLKQEQEILKKHQEEIAKIVEVADREVGESKLNDRQKELNGINDEFNDRRKVLNDAYNEDLKILQDQLKRKAITQQQYNERVLALNIKSEEATLKIAEAKGVKELEVNKKYNQEIQDFINGYNQTAYQKQREELQKHFAEMIELAQGDKAKVDELTALSGTTISKLDRQEEVRKKEITIQAIQTENEVRDEDSPEVALEKLQRAYDATKEFKELKFQEELAKLGSDQEAIRLLTAQHQQELLNDEQAHSDAKKEVWDKEKEAKLANVEMINNAGKMAMDLLGKNTVAHKALAIATTTVDTYIAAQKAYLSQMQLTPDSPIRATIAAAAAVLQGLARVKAIVSVKVPGKSDSSSAPSAPTAATAPVIQASQTAYAAQAVQDVRLVNPEKFVMKTYITDRDLKNNEEKSNFLNKMASI